ncbi:MAG: ATP-grasp domain-containing protein [Candidatus Omnitrophica bacterium]|nr:ATP-grasp domain-containing protein [Candidatus Omnitrophota bacterium]
MKPFSSVRGPVLVVHPSRDYFERVLQVAPNAVALAGPSRAESLPAASVIPADLEDADRCLRLIQAWEAQNGVRIAGIVTFLCDHLALTSELARVLKLPFHDQSTIHRSRYKHQTKTCWQEAGISTPRGVEVRSSKEMETVLSCLPAGPWLLKPVSASGSEWVRLAWEPAELEEQIAAVAAGLAHKARDAGDPAGLILVEEYIRGEEGSMDLFIHGSTAKIMRLNRKWMQERKETAGTVLGYCASRWTPAEEEELRQQAAKALQALGVRRGLCMLDFIDSGAKDGRTPDRFCFLEAGLRPGGDCLPEWSRYAGGYDPVRAAVLVSLGCPVELEPVSTRHNREIVAFHLMAPHAGELTQARWESLLDHPAVLSVEPYFSQGDVLRTESGGYQDLLLGAVVARLEPGMSLRKFYRQLYEAGEFAIVSSRTFPLAHAQRSAV